METPEAQMFIARLEDQAFYAAFEAGGPEERKELLAKAGLLMQLEDAEAIFQELTGELNEEDLGKVVGGGAGFVRPEPVPPGDGS
jgi:hypothetical protein